ncbi:Chromosome partition protein Smc [Carpediemonas membranifera]|uniref:Chromosome partition protein Smc n=1 Tax=Carpediemonas membranifera TaxID=201153 RepID=A0A8J6DZ60_9EUKA|nr:Chromosome partition protein Smc [Carpediemonas membranifera]|eukprot:KAG9389996.1 Chromosome partition protein Smc [Carpediemonas membranifera]
METELPLRKELYAWLVSEAVLSQDEAQTCEPSRGNKVCLNTAATQRVENGIYIADILNIMNKDFEMHPKRIVSLKDLSTPAARLHNWNIIAPFLSRLGVEFTADSKAMAVAGDHTTVEQLLEDIYRQFAVAVRTRKRVNPPAGIEQQKTASPTRVSPTKTGHRRQGSFITRVQSARTPLDFLVVTFCEATGMVTKQATEILTDSAADGRLHTLIADPSMTKAMVRWVSIIGALSADLAAILSTPRNSQLVPFTMSVITAGIYAPDASVVIATLQATQAVAVETRRQADMEVAGAYAAMLQWTIGGQGDGIYAMYDALSRLGSNEEAVRTIADTIVAFTPDNTAAGALTILSRLLMDEVSAPALAAVHAVLPRIHELHQAESAPEPTNYSVDGVARIVAACLAVTPADNQALLLAVQVVTDVLALFPNMLHMASIDVDETDKAGIRADIAGLKFLVFTALAVPLDHRAADFVSRASILPPAPIAESIPSAALQAPLLAISNMFGLLTFSMEESSRLAFLLWPMILGTFTHLTGCPVRFARITESIAIALKRHPDLPVGALLDVLAEILTAHADKLEAGRPSPFDSIIDRSIALSLVCVGHTGVPSSSVTQLLPALCDLVLIPPKAQAPPSRSTSRMSVARTTKPAASARFDELALLAIFTAVITHKSDDAVLEVFAEFVRRTLASFISLDTASRIDRIKRAALMAAFQSAGVPDAVPEGMTVRQEEVLGLLAKEFGFLSTYITDTDSALFRRLTTVLESSLADLAKTSDGPTPAGLVGLVEAIAVPISPAEIDTARAPCGPLPFIGTVLEGVMAGRMDTPESQLDSIRRLHHTWLVHVLGGQSAYWLCHGRPTSEFPAPGREYLALTEQLAKQSWPSPKDALFSGVVQSTPALPEQQPTPIPTTPGQPVVPSAGTPLSVLEPSPEQKAQLLRKRQEHRKWLAKRDEELQKIKAARDAKLKAEQEEKEKQQLRKRRMQRAARERVKERMNRSRTISEDPSARPGPEEAAAIKAEIARLNVILADDPNAQLPEDYTKKLEEYEVDDFDWSDIEEIPSDGFDPVEPAPEEVHDHRLPTAPSGIDETRAQWVAVNDRILSAAASTKPSPSTRSKTEPRQRKNAPQSAPFNYHKFLERQAEKKGGSAHVQHLKRLEEEREEAEKREAELKRRRDAAHRRNAQEMKERLALLKAERAAQEEAEMEREKERKEMLKKRKREKAAIAKAESAKRKQIAELASKKQAAITALDTAGEELGRIKEQITVHNNTVAYLTRKYQKVKGHENDPLAEVSTTSLQMIQNQIQRAKATVDKLQKDLLHATKKEATAKTELEEIVGELAVIMK